MKFPYQSSFIVGVPPPSVSPGSLLRWRPFVPITISDPAQTIRRSFTRALLDTGADQTVFPERLLPTLNLQPIASPGQQIVWRGIIYRTKYALARLVLSDGTDVFAWDAIVGFSAAPIPYIVLGQSGCLENLNVSFFGGNDRYTELQKNSVFPSKATP